MRQTKSLTSYLWCIYAFISLWMLRFYITRSSFVSLGQLVVIILTFLCLVYNNKFKIYRTKDDRLMLFLVFFIVINCLIQTIVRYDVTLKLIQLRSLAVSLLIIFPYFVSRSVRLGRDKGKFIHYLFLGMSLFILYRTYVLLELYLTTGYTHVGRIAVAQRYPVVINFVFLMALLLETKSRLAKVFSFFIAVLSLLLMVVSLTRGAYITILVDLTVLLFIRPKRTFWFTVMLIFLLSGMSLKYGQRMAPLRQAKSRFEYMIKTIKNPAIDPSATDRIAIWKVILDTNLANPLRFLFGSGELGVGQLGKIARGFSEDWTIGSAHSQYFDTFMRRGIVGLILFLILNYRMIKMSFRLRYDEKYGWFYTAMGIGYLAMLPYNIFEESFRFMTFGLFFYAIYGNLVSEFSVIQNKQC